MLKWIYGKKCEKYKNENGNKEIEKNETKRNEKWKGNLKSKKGNVKTKRNKERKENVKNKMAKYNDILKKEDIALWMCRLEDCLIFFDAKNEMLNK